MRVTLFISMVLIATSMAASAFGVYGGGHGRKPHLGRRRTPPSRSLVCALAALRFMRPRPQPPPEA